MLLRSSLAPSLLSEFKYHHKYYVNFFSFSFFWIISYFLFSKVMTSILKTQKANASNVHANGKRKRKAGAMDVEDDGLDVQASKKKNKQRVLLLSSRGITHRMRHLMNDLEALLPHVKKGTCDASKSVERRPLIPRFLSFFFDDCRFKIGLKISITSLTGTCRSEQLQ